MSNSSIDRLKYLDKSRYRFKKSSSASNLHDSIVKDKSIGESMFAIQTNRSTIIDIFNVLDKNKPAENMSGFSNYDPQKYFQIKIEMALKKKYENYEKIKDVNANKQYEERKETGKIEGLRRSISMKGNLIPQQQPSIDLQYADNIVPKPKQIGKTQLDGAAQMQLIQCQVCNRKFIESSYKKHVQFCQKVFFKKRPVFKSGSRDRKSIQRDNNR